MVVSSMHVSASGILIKPGVHWGPGIHYNTGFELPKFSIDITGFYVNVKLLNLQYKMSPRFLHQSR